MKKVFTLCVFAVAVTFSNAQVALNELYTDPSSGNQEFFELYNTSVNPIPENLDNYTLVTYYEEVGGISGFYVMDLPNMTINAKGYFVGAAASTFTVQGQTNLPSDFSWNEMPAGGAITKWEKTGSVYTQIAVPANLNDFFVTISGSGASHHVLVYKDGVLVNGFFGGTNSGTIPTNISAMPSLSVDMLGASPDFVINFGALTNNQFEYISGVTGTDNGYMRTNDGKCGVWSKSTAQAQHTPTMSNGSGNNTTGDLTISAFTSDITGDPVNSLLQYNITDGPQAAFAVEVMIYKDLGIVGELDAADILLSSNTIHNTSAGIQNVTLPFKIDPVILVAKTSAGCFDKIITLNTPASTLPVHLIRFQGNMNKNNKVTLNWTVAANETVEHFEVERSVNGNDFTTAAVVFSSDNSGSADYSYSETINNNDKVMYRLKMFDKGHDIDYSKILVFQSKSETKNNIRIFGNPVKDKLTFSYSSNTTQTVSVNIYDVTGRMLMSQKENSMEGINMLSLPLNSTFKTGIYVVEINNGTERQIAKFIKQ